jgi:diguanylate cyclase (GGDEF)-like protein
MAMTRSVGKAYLGAIRWGFFLAVLNLIAFAYLFFAPDANLRGLASEFAGVSIPILACIGCFGFRKTPGHRKLSQVKHLPAILGGVALTYGVGTMVYAYETRVLGRTSNPGMADLFYLVQYVFFFIAIALWPCKPLPGAMRWRTWSDAFVLLMTLLAFGWVYLIGPAVQESDLSALGICVNTAYPVADILIIFSVLQMMRKGLDPRFRVATHLFVFALAVNTIGDLYYFISRLEGNYVSGSWLDMTWPVMISMSALAGMLLKIRMQVPGFKEARNDEKIILAQRTWTLYAPYVMVPAVATLTLHVATAEVSDLIRNGLYICGLGLIIAILMRQLIVIAENGSLYASLRDAYDQLENKNLQVSLAADETEQMNERLRLMAEELAGQNRTLTESNEVLEQMATRDGMTGLANHRAFQERLKEELSTAQRKKHPLALALIDVDFFKQYNDQYGHPAGDEVLRSIARLLQETTRQGDLAARYGGEEFALLLPFVDRDEAVHILERLREAVSTFPFKNRRVTLSIGLCMSCEELSHPEQMIDQADKALYSAKSRGRNQVVVSSDLIAQAESAGTGQAKFDLASPMGYASVLAAGLQYYPPALVLEPQCALVAGLLATLELKDPTFRGNPQRVMWFAMRLAQEAIDRKELDMTPGMIRALGFGALLHDIGYLGISETLLASKKTYTSEDRALIEKHAIMGAELVRKFPGLAPALPLVRHHHERWDGKGYPDKYKGEKAPKGARILAYADALNAMSTDRPYAAKRTHAEICEEFRKLAGKQFDPTLLDAFLAIPESEWERLRNTESVEIPSRSHAA